MSSLENFETKRNIFTVFLTLLGVYSFCISFSCFESQLILTSVATQFDSLSLMDRGD